MSGGTLAPLLDSIYEAALQPYPWALLSPQLERGLGVVAVLSQRSPQGKACTGLAASSCDPAFVELYRTQYFALDPFGPYLDRLPVGCFEIGTTYVPKSELERTAFYREWMAPQGLLPGTSLFGVIDRDSVHGTSAIEGFQRGAGRPCGQAERELGKSLMPHLRHALEIHRQRRRSGDERDVLATTVDQLHIGLILIDGEGQARAANHTAARILEQRDGLFLAEGAVRTHSPQKTAELKGMFEETLRSCRGIGVVVGTRAVVLPRPSGRRPLEALILPIHAPQEWWEAACPVVALLFTDLEEMPATAGDALRCFFGLTRGEAALACELASGHSLTEAAEHLGIARETARKRLKVIFAKTDTSRQAALVRLLMSSPAQLYKN